MDMRMEIAKLHKALGATMIYVTHDQVEAMTLADKIVVLEGGIVQQIGAPIDLYKKPANKFVAGFIGSPKMNFLEVRVTRVSGSAVMVQSPTVLPVVIEGSGFAPGDRALLGVRPQYLKRAAQGASGTVKGNVSLVERLGAETIVNFETVSNERALAAIPQDEVFEPGSAVEFQFDPKVAHLFAAA
jgi:multiple sugar transport system ATP-binding protein